MEGKGFLSQRIDELRTAEPSGARLQMECSSVPQLIEACVGGSLVGFVPELAARAVKRAGLERCRVAELGDVKIQLSLVWRKNEEREAVHGVIAALRGWK